MRRLFWTIAAFVLLFFLTALWYLGTDDKYHILKAYSYFQILRRIENNSYYELPPGEIAKIHECVMNRSFYIPKRTGPLVPENESCFPQDKRINYVSLTESIEASFQDFQQIAESQIETREMDQIGYLKIRSFAKLSLIKEDVLPALERFGNNGINALVIDLRDNVGGTIGAALDLLRLFSPRESALVTRIEYRERGLPHLASRGRFASWKLAVIVNKRSASASELVAGVLQLWGAKVFGTPTFGKGTAQRIFQLADGGTLFLTTFTFYFSNGTTPEGRGITPDFEIRRPAGEEAGDPQLDAALKYLRGLK